MKINNVIINENERVEDLQRGGYMIIQDPERFCFGIDAVLLSSFCKVKHKERVIDLGCGNGIIPILLAARTKGKHFTGLEIQRESAELAHRSVILNSLSDKIKIDTGDIKNAVSIYGHSSFDVVCSNPPYMPLEGQTNSGEASSKAIARHEICCSLDDVLESASRLLKYGGRFYMVHRPGRITDILCKAREHGIEVKNIKFVHARIDKPPALVLVEALKAGKGGAKVLPPLIIYNEDGEYTEEIKEIYYGE